MTEYSFYTIVYLSAAALCAISLIATIVVFFKFNIKRAIGDITGSNAKKAIEGIREHNESARNADTERIKGLTPRKITDRITPSGKIVKKENYSPVSTTEKIPTAMIRQSTAVMVESGNATSTLYGEVNQQFPSGETTVLTAGETTVLTSDETTLLTAGETTVLTADQTTVLSDQNMQPADPNETTVLNNYFVIEEDITCIHSDFTV